MQALTRGLLAGAMALAAAPALAEPQLVLKSRGVPDPSLTALIAEVGQPMPVALAAGERPYDRIVAACGNNIAYLSLAEAQVPGLAPFEPSAGPRSIDLPACLGPGGVGQVEAAGGDTVADLAKKLGVPFREDVTDWRDIPGIGNHEEIATLQGVNSTINTLSLSRDFTFDAFPERAATVPKVTPLPQSLRDLLGPGAGFEVQNFRFFDPARNNGTLYFQPGTGLPQAGFDVQGNMISGGVTANGQSMVMPQAWQWQANEAVTPFMVAPASSDNPWFDPGAAVLLESEQPALGAILLGQSGDAPEVEAWRGAIGFGNDLGQKPAWLSANATIASLYDQRLKSALPAFVPDQLETGQFAQWRKAQTDFAGIINSSDIRVGNGLDARFGIDKGKSYFLPGLVETWQSIPLKPGVTAETLAAARQRLANIDPQGAAAMAPADKIVDPTLFHNIGNEQCGVGGGKPAFDAAAIARQIALTNKVLAEHGRMPDGGPVNILVLDNGFPDLDPAALDRLWPAQLRKTVTLASLNKTLAAGSANQALPPSFRVNIAAGSLDAEVPPDFPDIAGTTPSGRWHGLGVTVTAMGGAAFEPFRDEVALPLRFAFGAVGTRTGMSAAAFNTAIEMAAVARIDVINASFSLPSPNGDLNSGIAHLPATTLLVVAAGNDGKDLDLTDSYPPKFGGRSRSAGAATVITVGMSRPDGTIHPKSSWSGYYVDLLAPGCDIASYAIDDSVTPRRLVEARWTGTSFAAPLTSFAAGLLRYYHYDKPPQLVKARLIYSAEFSPPPRKDGAQAEQTTVASGVLNIERALAFPFNQFVLKDGRILFDTLDPQDIAKPTLCGKEFSLRRVATLAIRDGRVYYRNYPSEPERGDILDWKNCAMAAGDRFDLTVDDYATGAPVTVALDEVTDFIARLPGSL